jgi:DNA-3-methyladenine glycosylase
VAPRGPPSLPYARPPAAAMTLPIDPATPTRDVARALLGATLCRRLPDGTRLAGRIVETEAYLGLDDPACHSFHGRRTPRVASLYLATGHAYVYRIYGLHLCLNVVTGGPERPEAVLLRALAPLAGAERMRALRGGAPRAERDLCSGPGKLTQALDIGGAFDGHPLGAPPLWLEAGDPVPDDAVAVGPRIGLSERIGSRSWPLRFWVAGDPHVSRAGRR